MELALRAVQPARVGSSGAGKLLRSAGSGGAGAAGRTRRTRHTARTWPTPALSFELRAFLLAVAGTTSCGLQGDLCSLSCFPGSEPGRVSAADMTLIKSLTRPISCSSGLHCLTPCADSYHLFVSFPSENETNCTLCLLLFLVACLDRPCGVCCQTPTPPQVRRCAGMCWGECD